MLCVFLASAVHAHAWSNGGFSSDASKPDYGTHDFLAHHALDYVPDDLDFWLRNNLQVYLYGTELPDNKDAPLGDGIGDTTLHHVYYRASGQLQDDASARRARESYEQTLTYLASGNFWNAAKWIGVASHYVVDVVVFGHVMAAGTDWSAEKHHTDYEDWVNGNTNSYDASFKACLTSAGEQKQTSPYDAALKLAHDTTFDDTGKGHTTEWMDDNYNPNDSTFAARTCELLNHAAHAVATLIYTAAISTGVPEWSQPTLVAGLAIAMCIVLLRRKRSLLDGQLPGSLS